MARSGFGMVTACGREWTWESIDEQLRAALWGGSYAHDETERQAYINAACPTSRPTPGTTLPAGSELIEKLKGWITAHPLESVAIAGAVILLRK